MSSFINYLRWPVAKISLLNQKTPSVKSTFLRLKSTGSPDKTSQTLKNRSTLYYATAAVVSFVGFTYAAVPLYRMFCQVCWTACMAAGFNHELYRPTVTVEQQP